MTYSKCGPAPRCPLKLAGAAVRGFKWSGFAKADGGATPRRLGPQKPRRGASVRSRSPSAVRDKAGVAGQRAFGDPSAGFTQRRSQDGHAIAVWGQRPGVPRATFRGGGFSPLATRAESSDRRVSGPSVERARLRGRGGSGSLYRRLSKAGPVVAAAVPRSKPTSAGAQRSTQNWHGPGESDCLIKTKHCDGQR